MVKSVMIYVPGCAVVGAAEDRAAVVVTVLPSIVDLKNDIVSAYQYKN